MVLQFDMWNATPDSSYDWQKLKENIIKYGIRNSLFVAPMPTASTSQILGYNECIEPFTSNIYTRRTLAGEYVVINKYLINDLLKLNLWSENMKDKIIMYDGSIQNIDEIPEEIKVIYKTSWEMSQKSLINQSMDRGIYVDQSQSLNLFIPDPTNSKLSSMHFYSWNEGNGLKTGIYYLRSKPASSAQKFTLDVDLEKQKKKENKTPDKPKSLSSSSNSN